MQLSYGSMHKPVNRKPETVNSQSICLRFPVHSGIALPHCTAAEPQDKWLMPLVLTQSV